MAAGLQAFIRGTAAWQCAENSDNKTADGAAGPLRFEKSFESVVHDMTVSACARLCACRSGSASKAWEWMTCRRLGTPQGHAPCCPATAPASSFLPGCYPGWHLWGACPGAPAPESTPPSRLQVQQSSQLSPLAQAHVLRRTFDGIMLNCELYHCVTQLELPMTC